MNSQITSTLSENSCCICGSNRFSVPMGIREGYALVKCRRCKLAYTRTIPKLERDFMESAGKEVEYWSFPELYKKHKRVFDRFFRERFERICEYSESSQNVLDIGCGYGLWMSFLADIKIPVKGIDMSAEAVRFCRNSGLEAQVGRLEDFETDEKFSTIVICDVLEHLENPGAALEKCGRFLKPGGIIYVQVPNVLGVKIPWGHGLGLPHHIWQFNPRSLNKLLKKSGFTSLRYWTGIQGVIGAYEKGGPSWTTRMQWKLGMALKIGNRIQMIARKSNEAH